MIENLGERKMSLPYIYTLTRLCLIGARSDSMVRSNNKKNKLDTSDKWGIFMVGLLETSILPIELLVQTISSATKIVNNLKGK